ncbi:MAG TPA: protein phosphatase 2C domain-containing protein [Pyrinomonadaceae bacterium]|nr:protein phosphatase 2C domain-containing protein [Pyrinomonadaceae bacterium]
MEAEIHATTHIGRVRRNNEDNYLLLDIPNSKFVTKADDLDEFTVQSHKFEVNENGIVIAVSDALGEIASEIAVEVIKNMLTGEVPNLGQSFYESELIKRLYDATLYANLQIHNQGCTNPQFHGMGATITAVGITPNSADFIQVGDSRGYLVRKGEIFQITKDQTLVNQLIDLGEIAPEEAETHALKNVILQALGAQTEVYPDVVRLIPQRDDILLLCSDGLSNKIRANDLLRTILNNLDDLQNACRVLIQEANECGGEDNITAILVKLLDNNLPEQTDDSIVVYPLNFNLNE